MKLEERKPSGREKDQAAVERLAELREKLHSEDVSTARKAAFGLSWMQEDGLDIFVEALFGSFPRTTKQAAAYGLRSMNGRMRKMAEEVLTKGLTHSNRITKEACAKSLLLMKQGPMQKKGGFRSRRSRRQWRRPTPRSENPRVPRPRPGAKRLLLSERPAEEWSSQKRPAERQQVACLARQFARAVPIWCRNDGLALSFPRRWRSTYYALPQDSCFCRSYPTIHWRHIPRGNPKGSL